MNRCLAFAFASFSLVVVSCGGSSGGSSGSGATCSSSDPVQATCDGTACGGDIVGTWKLVTFCGPSCVVSVSDTITYGAGGEYSGGGTWTYGPSNTVTTTVGNASSSAAYCVKGDLLWTQRSTNCGPGQGTILTIVRRRDCGGAAVTPDAGR